MDIKQGLYQNQQQKFSISPSMFLSIELITLPILDLKDRIEKEILENPALEIDDISKTKIVKSVKNYQNSSSNLQSDQHNDFIENIPNPYYTLQDYLLFQLSLRDLDEREIQIAEIIITFIDDDGFFKEDIKELFPTEVKKARKVLELIQSFDPTGIASSSIREAILYQISISGDKDFNMDGYNIIKDCYDELLKRDDSKIEKKLHISKARLKKGLLFLKNFNPFPGRQYSQKQIKYIIPDAVVSIIDDEIKIKMNYSLIPKLYINKYIKELYDEQKNGEIRNKKQSNEEKYISNNINKATQFIDSINWRKSSLHNLIVLITIEQKDFFYYGPFFLKPLMMKDIAKKLDLSESTISRLSNGKYIDTKWGIFELKYFFSNSVKNRDKELSQNSVKEMIKKIITNNDNISDSNIMKILNEDGIKIARRTIAKYRKSLNIENSFLRNIINNNTEKDQNRE